MAMVLHDTHRVDGPMVLHEIQPVDGEMVPHEIHRPDGSIDEEKLIYNFDLLVADGIVQYSPTGRAVRFEDEGMPIEIIVSSALGAKPELGQTLADRFRHPVRRLTGKAVGDIDVTGHEIGIVNDTHLLAYNKFSGYRPHLLLLTDDAGCKQTEDMDAVDVRACWNLLGALRSSEYVAMFNCGPKSGCSRMHKHMQLLPRPADFVWWPDLVGWERPPLTFAYHEEALSPRMSAGAVGRIVEQLVREARAEVGIDMVEHFPHNVLLTRHWVVVIPRRASGVGNVACNAAGFLGMSWVSTDEKAEAWREAGPLNVLGALGYPAAEHADERVVEV